MRNSNYERKLRQIKEHERLEAVLLVSDSTHLTKIVVAWMGLGTHRVKRTTRQLDQSDEGTWQWLWDNTRFSKDELLQRIPSSDSKTIQKVRALIANRVLYPDGTVNSYVKRFLQDKVIRQFTRERAASPSR